MKIDKKTREKLKEQLIKSLKQEKKQTIYITLPYMTDDSSLDRIRHGLKVPENMTVISKVDPDIIGGFIVQHGSNIIDASVRSKINSLVDHLQNTL